MSPDEIEQLLAGTRDSNRVVQTVETMTQDSDKRLLLEGGADPSIRNRSGKTALDYVKDGEALKLFENVSSGH